MCPGAGAAACSARGAAAAGVAAWRRQGCQRRLRAAGGPQWGTPSSGAAWLRCWPPSTAAAPRPLLQPRHRIHLGGARVLRQHPLLRGQDAAGARLQRAAPQQGGRAAAPQCACWCLLAAGNARSVAARLHGCTAARLLGAGLAPGAGQGWRCCLPQPACRGAATPLLAGCWPCGPACGHLASSATATAELLICRGRPPTQLLPPLPPPPSPHAGHVSGGHPQRRDRPHGLRHEGALAAADGCLLAACATCATAPRALHAPCGGLGAWGGGAGAARHCMVEVARQHDADASGTRPWPCA
jgi:hypothetical protein